MNNDEDAGQNWAGGSSRHAVGALVTQYKEEGRPAIGLEGHMAQIREETPRAFR